jgi:hypothetical protein
LTSTNARRITVLTPGIDGLQRRFLAKVIWAVYVARRGQQ